MQGPPGGCNVAHDTLVIIRQNSRISRTTRGKKEKKWMHPKKREKKKRRRGKGIQLAAAIYFRPSVARSKLTESFKGARKGAHHLRQLRA
jgi:hypothetical protein